MGRLVISAHRGDQLHQLESVDDGDWISILKSIGEDPRVFFQYGDWRGANFLMSNMARVSFRGALIDRAKFRQFDKDFIDLSDALSAVDVQFLDSQKDVDIFERSSNNLRKLTLRLSESVPSDKDAQINTLAEYAVSTTPIVNAILSREPTFAGALDAFLRAQSLGSKPTQPNDATYLTVIQKTRNLDQTFVLLAAMAAAKPKPISPSASIWRSIMAKVENADDARVVLDLAKSASAHMLFPDYDMYGTAISVSQNYASAKVFAIEGKNLADERYGPSLFRRLETKALSEDEKVDLKHLVLNADIDARLTQTERFSILVRLSENIEEAWDWILKVDRLAYASDENLSDLLNFVTLEAQLWKVFSRCQTDLEHYGLGRKFLSAVSNTLIRLQLVSGSWQSIFDELDAKGLESVEELQDFLREHFGLCQKV